MESEHDRLEGLQKLIMGSAPNTQEAELEREREIIEALATFTALHEFMQEVFVELVKSLEELVQGQKKLESKDT